MRRWSRDGSLALGGLMLASALGIRLGARAIVGLAGANRRDALGQRHLQLLGSLPRVFEPRQRHARQIFRSRRADEQ